jgi:hypothetical protein
MPVLQAASLGLRRLSVTPELRAFDTHPASTYRCAAVGSTRARSFRIPETRRCHRRGIPATSCRPGRLQKVLQCCEFASGSRRPKLRTSLMTYGKIRPLPSSCRASAGSGFSPPPQRLTFRPKRITRGFSNCRGAREGNSGPVRSASRKFLLRFSRLKISIKADSLSRPSVKSCPMR